MLFEDIVTWCDFKLYRSCEIHSEPLFGLFAISLDSFSCFRFLTYCRFLALSGTLLLVLQGKTEINSRPERSNLLILRFLCWKYKKKIEKYFFKCKKMLIFKNFKPHSGNWRFVKWPWRIEHSLMAPSRSVPAESRAGTHKYHALARKWGLLTRWEST